MMFAAKISPRHPCSAGIGKRCPKFPEKDCTGRICIATECDGFLRLSRVIFPASRSHKEERCIIGYVFLDKVSNIPGDVAAYMTYLVLRGEA